MKRLTATFGSTQIDYYQSGPNPQILFQSGVHGDEFESIIPVTSSLIKYYRLLPDFIYIPKTSPSAVAQQTRTNQSGLDLNRSFFDNSPDEEIQANIHLLKNHHFKCCFSFHEDPSQTNFYLYDSGQIQLTAPISSFLSKISSLGFGLLNGPDDLTDPCLGYEFANGYKSFPSEVAVNGIGSFWYWCSKNQVVDRLLEIEIPGLLPLNIKETLVEDFFRDVVLPLSLNKIPTHTYKLAD